MVAGVDPDTALVVTVKLALVAPAATVTLAGTAATGLLLESATCTPPAGAGPSSATMPVVEVPPVTLEALRPSAVRLGAITVSVVLCVAPP